LHRGAWQAVFRYPRYRFRPSHCDALHVDLWHHGQNVLRDGGSYSYNAEDHWRRYFAGTASHNTIEFDGRDPMPALGRFLRGAWLKADSVSCSTDRDGQHVAQAAYTDWRGASHLRQISLSDERLIVRGRANLLNSDTEEEEFDRIRTLFDDLERKRDIAEFLELADEGEGVRIFIGSENKLFSLTGSSLVVSPYMNADRKIIGAVGVIGPTRLNYGRIVPIVDYTAQLVGKLIADRS
jgi:hypothetical protein